jgi:hypothetical protein
MTDIENKPFPENLDAAKTTESLQTFEDRINGLDQAFNTKTETALKALEEFETEFNTYLQEQGINPMEANDKIPTDYGEISKKIIDIGFKINELRDSESFNIEEFGKVKLAFPTEAQNAGFDLINNNTINCPAGPIQFLPEEGVIKELVWQEDELLVTTSKDLKFGIKLKSGNPIIREIK